MIDFVDNNVTPKKFGAPKGQKRPLISREVWVIHARIEISGNIRILALFNLSIDSKLRGCDLVRLKLSDVYSSRAVLESAIIIQKKTSRLVQFEITKLTSGSVLPQITNAKLDSSSFLFPSRHKNSDHLSTRQYHRMVDQWVSGAGLEVSDYGTHALRQTKGAQFYRNTMNLRAVQCCSVTPRLKARSDTSA